MKDNLALLSCIFHRRPNIPLQCDRCLTHTWSPVTIMLLRPDDFSPLSFSFYLVYYTKAMGHDTKDHM